MSASTWDPAQYLRFGGERLRPALDLLAQVQLERPRFVVDLGCGAGNVTTLLKKRFPTAEVLGIDGSPPMLQKARAAAPDCSFVEADITCWQPDRPPDVIFSNAALHWVPRHDVLFPRLISILAPGGVLAVQVPAMHDAPFRRLQSLVASEGPWAEALRGIGSAPDILPTAAYWDLLWPRVARLDIWETTCRARTRWWSGPAAAACARFSMRYRPTCARPSARLMPTPFARTTPRARTAPRFCVSAVCL